MKKLIFVILVLAFAGSLFAQTPMPGVMPRWDRLVDWIKNGQYTMTYKTFTSPTIAGTIGVSGATNYTQVNAASGSANPWDYTGTLGVMNGSDTFTLFDVNLTNANHTSTSNTVSVMDVANITGDAQADEYGIKIGSGWDYSLYLDSPVLTTSTIFQTMANSAGGSANPYDYTATLGIMDGSDDFTLFDVNLTNADHTGSNTIQVMDVAGITGDAHATEIAFKVATGWDYGFYAMSPVMFGSTLEMSKVNDAGGSANPFDFTGTVGVFDNSDDFTVIDINLTNVDHTGTGNTLQAIDISGITGDAQATETAISIGTGWDLAIAAQSGVRIGTTNAETITQVDTFKTAGGVARWLKLTVSGSTFWCPVDTALVK